jgi:hypothetical protein
MSHDTEKRNVVMELEGIQGLIIDLNPKTRLYSLVSPPARIYISFLGSYMMGKAFSTVL